MPKQKMIPASSVEFEPECLNECCEVPETDVVEFACLEPSQKAIWSHAEKVSRPCDNEPSPESPAVLGGTEQELPELLCRLSLHVVQGVAVDVEREGNRGVA
jgi:hypothetical protein